MHRTRSTRIAAAAMSLACALPAAAQGGYPEKPIRLVVGYAPGGIGDITARLVAQKISASMGQQVVVDNRPSAGGIVAAEAVAKAEPDGYTLLHMTSGNTISASLFKSLPFDIVHDFAPVSRMGSFDILVAVDKDAPFRGLADMIAAARASPDRFNLGSVNIGSTQNLAAELFKSVTGLQVPVVPFKATPALLMALKSRDIQAAFEMIGPVLPLLRSGELRALAVSGKARFAGLPEVPTVMESGLPTYQVTAWNAIAVPAKTSPAVIERLNKEVNAALALPDVRQRFQELGMSALGGTPEELRRLLDSEISRWAKVVADAHIERQ